jgi:uncharacterized membrane protein YwzB
MIKVKKQKPLRCKHCGHLVGQVRVKPAFRRRLLLIALAIAFGFELVSNFITNLLLNRLGL